MCLLKSPGDFKNHVSLNSLPHLLSKNNAPHFFQSRPPRNRQLPGLGGVLVSLLLVLCQPAALAQTSDAEVKAKMIVNFLSFASLPGGGGELVLGVVGGGPVSTALGEADGAAAGGRRIRIVRMGRADAAQLGRCDAVFIDGGAGANEARRALASVRGKGVLTIGDTGRFLSYGGMINFVIKDRNVRFEINNTAARDAGIQLSSKLLRLAVNQ